MWYLLVLEGVAIHLVPCFTRHAATIGARDADFVQKVEPALLDWNADNLHLAVAQRKSKYTENTRNNEENAA